MSMRDDSTVPAHLRSAEAIKDYAAQMLFRAEGFLGQAQTAVGEADAEAALHFATLTCSVLWKSADATRKATRMESGTSPAVDVAFIEQPFPVIDNEDDDE